MLVQAGTRDLNPTFDTRAIEKALEDDPSSAQAEYFAQFRSDVETFVNRDAIDACTIVGRHERPPVSSLVYQAIADPSGGSGADPFTLAIGHQEQPTTRQLRSSTRCARRARRSVRPTRFASTPRC